MSDWLIYVIVGAVVLAMSGRLAIFIFFPNSDIACWLDENFPESFDSDGDCGDGGGD